MNQHCAVCDTPVQIIQLQHYIPHAHNGDDNSGNVVIYSMCEYVCVCGLQLHINWQCYSPPAHVNAHVVPDYAGDCRY